ncbi:MAG: glycosyl hydrolase-related protein [Chitinophagaceae bacterium]
MNQLKQRIFGLILAVILLLADSYLSAQTTAPWFGKIHWVSGYGAEVSGERIDYFSAFPDYVHSALLTRVTDGNKSISWESAPAPAKPDGDYVYFCWVAAHSTGTNSGIRNFDLFINNRKTLTFTTFPGNSHPDWTFGGPDSTRIVFHQLRRDLNGDAHGLAYLRVPRQLITPGRPLQLKITGQAQNSADWFMTFRFLMEEKISIRNPGFLLHNNRQVLVLDLLHFGTDLKIEIRVDQDPPIHRIAANGFSSFDIPVRPVRKTDSVHLRVLAGTQTLADRFVLLEPVQPQTIYILPHSHFDLGYTDLQPRTEEKQVHNLETALEYIERTKNYPEDARFLWNLEGTYSAWLLMNRGSDSLRQAFLRAVRNGSLSINGMFMNTLTGLCRPEELLQLFRYSTVLEKLTGVKTDAAMISDVPGYTWGLVEALAQAGIKYLSAAPNMIDRIGTIMQEHEEKPFYWVSASGLEKVLVWVPYKGYALSHGVQEFSTRFVSDYLAMLREKKFPYDISCMRWSGHGDNAVPELQVSEHVKQWNETYASPHFVVASASTAFRAFEKKYGKDLPRRRGDWTGYWEDGSGSSAFETAQNRNSSARLSQAETIWAMMRPDPFPRDAFEKAWRFVMLYSEHTWGADESVTRPESHKTLSQWVIKKSFSDSAHALSLQLLNQAAAADEQRSIPHAVRILNTQAWLNGGLVKIPAGLSAAGDIIQTREGKTLSSQRLSTGELAFICPGIAPFSQETFFILPGRNKPETEDVFVNLRSLDNGKISVHVDEKTGAINTITRQGVEKNFAGTGNEGALNQYLFLKGDDPANAQRNGDVVISILEKGPVLSSLRIESPAPGCRKLTRNIELAAGADFISIDNILDKEPAELNPRPGDYHWANVGGKEAVHFAFPFRVQEGKIRLDMPFSVIRPEDDQLPGSCKNWMSTGQWVDVSNDREGITLATPDAPLVEIGYMSANLLGGQYDPAAWRKQIEPSQTVFSWALNNHWETNYRASQDGIIRLRYALRPHGRFSHLESTRFATGFLQPLIVSRAEANPEPGSLMLVSSPDILVMSVKPAEEGHAIMITLFNSSEKACKTSLTFRSPVTSLYKSNTGQQRLEKLSGEIDMQPYEVLTLRAEW